jgi:hypothetical protein
MAKNRKNMSAAVRFGPSIKALLLCLFIGGAGIGYVWQKTQISQLGRQVKALEVNYADLVRSNQAKVNRLDTMRTPRAIEEQVVKLRLGLVEPTVSQKVRLVEIPATGRVQQVDRQIAHAPP